ncbi:MAG TPA: LPS assembly protein LptD [Gammaproteobacteria bacterium]|nr:LPS assembly protein LptD [Gammaproteobacteria bacterium]
MKTDRRSVRLLFLAPVLAGALGANHEAAAADDAWSQCGPGWVLPEHPEVERDPSDPDATFVTADSADMVEGGVSVLTGNVIIDRGREQLGADKVSYDEPGQVIDAEGNVRYWNQGFHASGASGRMLLDKDQSTLENASFIDLPSHGRGTAEHVVVSGRDRVNARRATYTTCNPGSADWLLAASRIELDRTTDVGSATNVWVKFKKVPVFYSPYLTFPLSDKRKTGFLVPSFRVSGSNGVEATVPYYFNIAPNYDATLALRPMSDRGIQTQGEFRYLTKWGEGLFGGEYLPEDREFDDDRAAFRFQHGGEFIRRWRADANFDWVSDNDYFEDLGTELAISSQSFLERRADLTYTGDAFWARARAQGYQTIDETLASDSRPYERLPQLYAATSLKERNRRLNVGASAEAVRFDRDASVTGGRLDLRPSLSYPYRTAGTFFVPNVALRYTYYKLDGVAAGADEEPDRLVPTASVDSGLFFERSLDIGEGSFIQTLEPRAFYLFVPFDEQRDLPVFDTGEYTFTFAQLFREDRFSGADRVGDANQLSLALTTRLLSAEGEEIVRGSVGQIRYFRDRKVTLPGEPRETQDGSDLAAEVAASFARRWRVLGAVLWNPGDEQTNRSTLSLRYQPDERRVINLSYRFIRDLTEQTDVSLAWPLATNWRAVARFNYSLEENTTLETFAGIEYESCCWGLRLVGRRYLTNTEGDHSNAIFLELELKGLAGLGTGTSGFLEQSIPGYRNEF